MTEEEKEVKRVVTEQMFIERIYKMYPSLVTLWPFGWKPDEKVCLVIVKPDKIHARYMLPINNRRLRFQAAAAGLVRDGRRHETAMYWTGEGEEERDDAVLCIASAQ